LPEHEATAFDSSWRIYFETLEALEASFIGREIFISPPDLYGTLTQSNPKAAACVYWVEMLGRSYLAGAAGAIRSLRWLKGVQSSISQENFLSFASNLRGLLESAADQCYSLKDVPKTLAESYGLIMAQLHGRSEPGTIYICEELENLLIHFYHARRRSKGEDVESTCIALTSARYLEFLQGGTSGPIFELYAQLCKATHPATGSLMPFVAEDPQGGYVIKAPQDAPEIRDFCTAHAKAILHMTAGMNPCLLTLQVLNEFPLNDLHTDRRILSLSVPGWPALINLINRQREKPGAPPLAVGGDGDLKRRSAPVRKRSAAERRNEKNRM
jgi:hypothetical protein